MGCPGVSWGVLGCPVVRLAPASGDSPGVPPREGAAGAAVLPEATVNAAFNCVDQNCDGVIDRAEWSQTLQECPPRPLFPLPA